MSNYAAGQQWGQYPQPRLQLEHEYDYVAPQPFPDSYQFNPDAFQPRQFTASPPTQSVTLQGSQSNGNSRSSSYTRGSGHSPSASVDTTHALYTPGQPSQNFATFGQNSAFLTTSDQHEYHNNSASYEFQAQASPPPRTATSLSAITTVVAPTPPTQSYYLPRTTNQPGSQPKVKRQRVPEPINEPKEDEDADMEEEGGARAKPYVLFTPAN
ncbi:hypothetical protein C8R44DRAFT_113323 [Mycena epipterygia]|nr:hypothetical protein C8R44DRAFT_113323 [Mycena epipterygia]